MSNPLNVKLPVSLYEPALPELTEEDFIQFCVDSGIPIPIPQNQFFEQFTRSQGEAEVIIPQGQGKCSGCGAIVYVLKNGTPNPTKHKCQ